MNTSKILRMWLITAVALLTIVCGARVSVRLDNMEARASYFPNNVGAVDLSNTGSVSNILGSANGGTASGFFSVSGPASTTKTFTFPNASSTVLTSNAAVTVAQGGTGLGTLTAHGVVVGEGTSNVAITAAGTAGQMLLGQGASADPTYNTMSGDGTLTSGGSLAITGLASASVIPVTTAFSFGATPGTAGGLRFANNTTIMTARNAANSADLTLASTDNANNGYLNANTVGTYINVTSGAVHLYGSGADALDTTANGISVLRGMVRHTRTNVSASDAIALSDYIVLVNRSGAVTETLPSPAAVGTTICVKDASGAANTNNITVSHNSAENIDGTTTKVINAAYGGMCVTSDGTNWFTITQAFTSAIL